MFKVGITERGDPSLDSSWTTKMDSVDMVVHKGRVVFVLEIKQSYLVKENNVNMVAYIVIGKDDYYA